MNESETMEPIWHDSDVGAYVEVHARASPKCPMCSRGDFQPSLGDGKRAWIQERWIYFCSRKCRDAYFKPRSTRLPKVESDGETAYLNKYFHANPTLADGGFVLDAGGGTGQLLNYVRKARLKVLADIDKQKLLRSNFQNKVLCDIQHLPFKDLSFKLSTCCEVIEHVENSWIAAIELARVSRRVLLTTPNNSGLRRILWRIRRKPEVGSLDHVREYSPSELRGMFKRQGCFVEKHQGIGFVIEKPEGLFKIFYAVAESIPYLAGKSFFIFSTMHHE